MKKLLYCAAALATLLFAGSCQRENLEPAVEGATVTYSVQVPGAMTTKAGEAYSGVVNKLVYEVHRVDAEGKTSRLYQDVKDIENGFVSFDIEFVRNQNFKVLFWAQKDGVYNDAQGNIDLKSVKVPTTLTSNSADYEAFYGTDEVTNGNISAKGGNIELTRAVSMLNIGTTAASLRVGGEAENVILEGSAVTVKGLPNTLNIMTGEATPTDNIPNQEYSSAAVPKVNGDYETFTTAAGESYVYVAKNYVGFSIVDENTDKSTVDVTLTILTDEGPITHEIPSVPLKRNYKTNIVGDLITANAKYSVTLTDSWATDTHDIVLVSNAADLQSAINDAPTSQKTEIKLDGDIDLNDLFDSLTKSTETASKSLDITAGKNITLDLNGYTLTGVDETKKSFGLINNMGNLTIVNTAATTGKILLIATIDRNWDAYSSVISAQPGSTLTVGTGVEIQHLGGTDMAYGIDILTNGKGTSVEVVIDGATVKSTYRAVRQFLNGVQATNSLTVKANSVIQSTKGNKSIWMQDPSKSANTGSLVIEAGAMIMTDVYLDVTEGSTEWPVYVSIADSALQGEATVVSENVPAGYVVEKNDGVWTVAFHPVAKIGDKGYWSLNAAVAAVQDGETITLVANEVFSNSNYSDNGGWKDGLGCYGDKSYTIDLNGFTISQNGDLNDYLIFVKNNGEKENVITLKNGTLDAGTTAYCALCSSSSHNNKVTINLENITLYNNISNGSTIKLRGGAELNIKEGTKIIGKDSYLGVECIASTVNIYDGAEIYMNGTSSYNGCLVGVGGYGTINVYGGYGKGVKGGFIAMTSGGTINVAGGEWIANTDGTVGDNSNLYVLTAQSNKYESGFAGPSIINVTGGTLRGGMDAWVLNNLEGEKAELNISGGNFNANPTNYLAEDCFVQESNGIYEVYNGIAVRDVADLKAATKKEGTIYIVNDITVDTDWSYRTDGEFTKPVTIDGMGHTIKFTGKVSNPNNNNAFRFENLATVKNLTIDISETSSEKVRAISTKSAITVDNCTFIGNATARRGIIFGEGASNFDFNVIVTNSSFVNWGRGITDNENGKDVKKVVVENNVFTNAPAYLSAYENITFIGNQMTNSAANITSYTAAVTAKVTAIDNTLDANQYNIIGSAGKVFSIANVNAQEGFTVNAQ